MKTVTTAILFLFTMIIGFSQEEKGITISVEITNALNDEGKAIVALHTADTFMKGPGIKNLEGTITDGKVSFSFEDVPPGTYAIMALHDANANNRMDYEPNGMPKESYGMSGNSMTMGPPSFQDAQFEVADEDLSFDIRF